MTPQQLSTIKSDILASGDASVIAARDIGNHTELARLYNLPSAKIVWKSAVPVDEYRGAITWNEVDALTVGKARIWDWITGGMTLSIRAADALVRQGLADCWASNTATRAGLLAISKRAATRAEALYATGTGTDAAPAVLEFEGQVTIHDIGTAMRG